MLSHLFDYAKPSGALTTGTNLGHDAIVKRVFPIIRKDHQSAGSLEVATLSHSCYITVNQIEPEIMMWGQQAWEHPKAIGLKLERHY
jgi:hypothetical protein